MKIIDYFFLKLKLCISFFFNNISEKVFDKVSTVFPDFEMITKRTLDKFSFFLNDIIFFSSMLLKK
jgi:hypothetical protein